MSETEDRFSPADGLSDSEIKYAGFDVMDGGGASHRFDIFDEDEDYVATFKVVTEPSSSGSIDATVTPPTTQFTSPAPDPWPTVAQACGLMRGEARMYTPGTSVRRRPIELVEQAVDCEARVVSRILLIKDKKVAAKAFAHAQETADRFACSSPRNRTMLERDGWAFRWN